jgi:hypothetical protein
VLKLVLLRAGLALVGIFTIVLFPMVQLAPSASAAYPACPAYAPSFVGSTWTPSSSNVTAGIEAPIQLRVGADLCDDGVSADDSGVWIGVEPAAKNAITQIGLIKLEVTDSTAETCRFWATGAGTPHVYNCNGDAGGTYVYFRIRVLASSSSEYYSVEDCGTAGGYGSCTAKYTGQPYYGAGSWAAFASESAHGCQDTMMGGTSSPVHFGTSAHPLHEQNAVGGSWASHNLDAISGTLAGKSCSQYQRSFSKTAQTTWDTRN